MPHRPSRIDRRYDNYYNDGYPKEDDGYYSYEEDDRDYMYGRGYKPDPDRSHKDEKPRRRDRSRSLPRRALDHISSALGISKSDADDDDNPRRNARTRAKSPDYSDYSDYSDDDRGRRRTTRRSLGRRRSSYTLSPSPPPRRSRTRTRGRDRSVDEAEKWKQRLVAAADAAAIEAFRLRKEPGSWTGAKGRRLATAAISAAAVDAGVDNGSGGRGKRIESALAGLVMNRVLNGPRREVRKETRRR